MELLHRNDSMVPKYLTYGGLVRYDIAEEQPYQLYMPVIDQTVYGTSIYDVLERGRELLGVLLIEKVLDGENVPESDISLPTADSDEMPTFLNVEIDRFKHMIKPTETIICPISALRTPERFLSRVFDMQPVFITERGRGAYAVVTMRDFDMYQSAVSIILDKEDIKGALDQME